MNKADQDGISYDNNGALFTSNSKQILTFLKDLFTLNVYTIFYPTLQSFNVYFIYLIWNIYPTCHWGLWSLEEFLDCW